MLSKLGLRQDQSRIYEDFLKVVLPPVATGEPYPKDLESVALAITKIALTRFLTNPIFHAKTEDSALLALGCEVRCLLLFHAKFSRLSCCWYILRYWNSYFPTWLTFTSCTRFEIT